MYKHILYTALLLLAIVNIAQSQDWEIVHSENNGLSKIQIIDNTIYTIGNREVKKSTDLGKNWETQFIGTMHPLSALFFLDETTGYVAGYEGVVAKTTNGGETWDDVSPELFDYPSDISFIDENTGWVCGRRGLLIKTTDGGNSWEKVNTGFDKDFSEIQFIDKNYGWVVGGYNEYREDQDHISHDIILKTTDGGASWIKCDPPFGTNSFAIHIEDKDNVWIAGQRGILNKTTDGGKTWENHRIGLNKPIFDIEFVSRDTAYIVGGWGSTSAVGFGHAAGIPATRIKEESPGLYAEEHDISKIYDKKSDNDYPMGGLVFKTVDGGQNWTPIAWFADIDQLFDVEVTPDGAVYVVGGNKGFILRMKE